MRKHLVASLLLVFLSGCDINPSKAELDNAKVFIDEIEKHLKTNSKVPTNEDAWEIMKSLGLRADEQCRPCYQKESDNSYIVYFGTTLGESYVYDSKSKSWE